MKLRTPPGSPPQERELAGDDGRPVSDASMCVFKGRDRLFKFEVADQREIHVSPCNVRAIGLRDFVTIVMKELSLSMGKRVEFNMNSNAIIDTWEDVFIAEKCYTNLLGISQREYRCFAFTHEPAKRLCYLILEEQNHRSTSWLPSFQFKAMVICWYDERKEVTNVQVEYDQLGFYMHCFGLHRLHQAFTRRVLSPLLLRWARAYTASWLIGLLTFFLHVAFFTFLFLRIFVTSNVGQCCLSCSSS
jgi:hypothetical protein